MQDFSQKVEDTFRRVEERIHEAAPHAQQKVNEAAGRIEKEAQELIAYIDAEVVPAIRSHSTNAMRIAAEKLTQLADYVEGHGRS
jgi:hypothetical protein